MVDRKISIPGAVCAGLSATYTPRRRGVETLVFEALGVGREV
jgi:hypothetical protein